MERKSFWKTLAGYVGPRRGRFFVMAACSALVGVAVALQPLVIKYIVDDGINRPGLPSQRFAAALGFTSFYLFLSVFRVAVWVFGYRKLISAVEEMLLEMRSRFFHHVQHLCFRFHDRTSSGEMFNYMFGTPINSLREFLRQFSMHVPYQAVSWLVVLFTISRLNLPMTGITLVMVAVIVLINRRSARIVRAHADDFMRTESAASRHVADMLRGSRAIKIHAVLDQVSDFFSAQMNTLFNKGYNLAVRQQVESVKPELLQYACIAIIYGAGSYLCIYGDLTVGEFFAFIASINLLMGPLLTIMNLNLVRANAESGLERIENVLGTRTSTPERPPAERADIGKQAAIARRNNWPLIEYRGVAFGHGRTRVFEELDCAIREGESIALVGPSGSGKTTFVNLLLRLYDPWAGTVLFNRIDLKWYSLAGYRALFGVVPQDPFFFQVSIRENLRIAAPGAGEEEMKAALDSASALDFVSELPEGLDTLLSESGVNLSGGQKQRLAIARAILGRPRHYIFDEATAALDNESEEKIQRALKKIMGGHTTIIIAHRLSTIRSVDRILVLERGKIVQEGGYERLAREEGLFRKLLESGSGGAGLPPPG